MFQAAAFIPAVKILAEAGRVVLRHFAENILCACKDRIRQQAQKQLIPPVTDDAACLKQRASEGG